MKLIDNMEVLDTNPCLIKKIVSNGVTLLGIYQDNIPQHVLDNIVETRGIKIALLLPTQAIKEIESISSYMKREKKNEETKTIIRSNNRL